MRLLAAIVLLSACSPAPVFDLSRPIQVVTDNPTARVAITEGVREFGGVVTSAASQTIQAIEDCRCGVSPLPGVSVGACVIGRTIYLCPVGAANLRLIKHELCHVLGGPGHSRSASDLCYAVPVVEAFTADDVRSVCAFGVTAGGKCQ